MSKTNLWERVTKEWNLFVRGNATLESVFGILVGLFLITAIIAFQCLFGGN